MKNLYPVPAPAKGRLRRADVCDVTYTVPPKSVLAGEKDGKNIWKDEKSAVPNKEQKSRVEFYKEADRGKQKGGPEL